MIHGNDFYQRPGRHRNHSRNSAKIVGESNPKKTSNLLKSLRQSSVDFITNSIELKITILQYDGESINLKLLSI